MRGVILWHCRGVVTIHYGSCEFFLVHTLLWSAGLGSLWGPLYRYLMLPLADGETIVVTSAYFLMREWLVHRVSLGYL
jgi:hypothetical protein